MNVLAKVAVIAALFVLTSIPCDAQYREADPLDRNTEWSRGHSDSFGSPALQNNGCENSDPDSSACKDDSSGNSCDNPGNKPNCPPEVPLMGLGWLLVAGIAYGASKID